MNTNDLEKILENHKLYLDKKEGGVKADLRGVDLAGANLWDANLRGANLREANLRGTYLTGADLRWANLRGANLRLADLQGADLREVKLQGADLREADLYGADLWKANIRNCIGNDKEIKSLKSTIWNVVWTDTIMAIGCEQHPIKDWWNFSDEEISKMDLKALEWWKEWKPKLQGIIEKPKGA